jgi:hypothetical protein
VNTGAYCKKSETNSVYDLNVTKKEGVPLKDIHYAEIVKKVAGMCQEANYDLGEDVVNAFKSALKSEASETGKDVLNQLIENANIATSERVPMCQDTGVSVFIVKLGQDCHITGETFNGDRSFALFALYPDSKDYSRAHSLFMDLYVPGLVAAQLTQDAILECSLKSLFQFI